MTAKIFAIANQKGGVGKTTTAINLSTGLAAVGYKTLVIDLDPQGNASTGLGVSHSARDTSIYEILISDIPISSVISNTLIDKLHVIPSKVELAAAEIELLDIPGREKVLKNKIQNIDEIYDFIILDCPPSLGMLTINALAAADSLLIPLQCEFFALEGLVHLSNTCKLIKQELNKDLKIAGIILTMMDRRNKLCLQVEQDVRETFGDVVFVNSVPRNIKLSEAPSHGKPALIYDDKCSGSLAYMLIVREMLTKLNMLNNEEYNNAIAA